ncbi:DegT/DnrJ/EryC1/StrS family aminotransferase [Algoriphagus machipongonensis]|uniref:Pleiotropic regulatory protein DegT n=1 Tax=Algoriphagus machipongonensis TaxID=388413 RepID=A3I2T5_9BACT|nr:DegT/DnrJ/EryC1/StrS family aminotransferase [Algoriphagus machipongonensis]EAZ79389.1 pleiotropic regulatory protein DegT [Algoriphagus machipongonensis]
MEIPFLNLSQIAPKIQDSLKAKFTEMLEKGMYSGGTEVEKLEKSISSYLKASFSVSCANGSDALEIALRGLGIGAGDEVIVPALTWVSTAEAVSLIGAQPVFWDTDEDGLLAENWHQAITEKTKAVIPVHLYGKMPAMDSLVKKAKEHKLFVVEDAAQAFGAFQSGKAAGTWGDVGCLSFYPTKNLGALGEAGMCITADSELANRLRLLLNHGQIKRDQHLLVGRNSRIDSIQAGFINVFFEYWAEMQAIRKKLALRYIESLISIDLLRLPSGVDQLDYNGHLFVIQTENRDSLKRYLEGHGVKTSIHYPDILPDMKPFLTSGEFETARKISKKGLSLPLNPWLKEEEQAFIIEKIRLFFK